MIALSVVLMMLTTVIPVFMYVIPIVTGLLVLFVSDISNKNKIKAIEFAFLFWEFRIYFNID